MRVFFIVPCNVAMCDWSSMPAGELGLVPFFGLQKDSLPCAVQPTGLLLCDDTSTPSTVFAEVGQQLNEVRFGRLDARTRVERLQPCYWYEDHGQTLCRQPITGETTTPVMLDALRTNDTCTFGGGRYTSAPTPSAPDNVVDAVDLRLILYTLFTDKNKIEQLQTILTKVPVNDDLVLEDYLEDSAHNGVLRWQTTDKLVEPRRFQAQLTLVREESFNGLAVLTMAVMPGSGDTRAFEVKGSFAHDRTAHLVRRHVVRRMDVTPDTPPDFNITKLITVAQEYVDLQTAVDEPNKTLRDTWIEALQQIVYGDIDDDSKRLEVVSRLYEKMRNLYQGNETTVRDALRAASTTNHECSHEVHRLHMSPILYGACRDYTAPVLDTNGPVRTPHSVQGEDFVIPVPPSAMQSDAFAQGTMPVVYTPPRRTQAVGSSSSDGYEVQQDDDVPTVVNHVPDFNLLDTLCVVLQGFPTNLYNMDKMFEIDKLQLSSTYNSSVGTWITRRLFKGERSHTPLYGEWSGALEDELSMVDAFVRDWHMFGKIYGYYGDNGRTNPDWGSGDEVITSLEIYHLMNFFFPGDTWSWPEPNDFVFIRPIVKDGIFDSWPELSGLSVEQKRLRIKTGLIFNTLRYDPLDDQVRYTGTDGKTNLVWVGVRRWATTDPDDHKTTRREALGRLLAFVNKGMFPEGPDCLLTETNKCLCILDDNIQQIWNCTAYFNETFLLQENVGQHNIDIPNSDFAMCDATAHQELLLSNRTGGQGGPINVMFLVLYRLFPDLYARFLTFLSCRSVVDETPKDSYIFTSDTKGLSRPVVVHTARDEVCAELSDWNLKQSWEMSAKNSFYVTRLQPVSGRVASHDVLRLVRLGLASEKLRQDVCQRWGAFKTPIDEPSNFDLYATAHRYQLAQGLLGETWTAQLLDQLQSGVDTTISVLPVKLHVHTDTVDLTQPENTASVHQNQTLYEWFAMFDHTKDTHTFRIDSVEENHVYQYTGFGQPLLTPARDHVSLESTSYDVIEPNNVPSDHKFSHKFLLPFQKWIQEYKKWEGRRQTWLTPERNHLPPSQRQAAISECRFDISPDFLAWRWNARAMASDGDSHEDIVRRISEAEEGVAHLTTVATGQCGLVMGRASAHITSSPTLQWTRGEDGRTYQIDENFGQPEHVLYVFRD
jgi:hypothetical protein